MLFKRISVGDTERVLLLNRKRLLGILVAGDYVVSTFLRDITEERHSLKDPVFTSEWADFLVKERPELATEHFATVETNDAQVALVFIDGKLTRVLGPATRTLFWKGPREVRFELVNVKEQPEVEKDRILSLYKLGISSLASFASIETNKVGLLYLDNQFVRVLQPGTYAFWAVRAPRVEVVDMRRTAVDVAGQEILTKDKVSIRVNIVAEYKVVDPVKAGIAVKSFVDHLYRLLQLAVRQTLGKRTLDEVLAEKVDIDAQAAETVRAEMASLGVETGAIALKDIILPGDIRTILNEVVAAEKQAQANLIRRREETAATRSLLNTAKLMEDNPILIRLKELETIEKVTDKVGNLTVLGGFEGLLNKFLPASK